MKNIELKNPYRRWKDGTVEAEVWIDGLADGYIEVSREGDVGGSYTYENLTEEEELVLIDLIRAKQTERIHKKQLPLFLREDLHRRFKARCAARDMTMTEVLTKFVEDFCR